MLATDLEILFEDNHLLAVYKSVGIPTQDDSFSAVSLESLAKAYIKEKYAKPGNVFLHPVHRIDKPVSGIVLFAKTSKALSRMNEQMRDRSIKKTYVAMTENYPPARSATLEHYLVHDEHFARISSSKDPEAKQAVLFYQLIEKKEGRALVEIDLKTGRYHQIRAQLAAIGCPIVGDKKYGAKSIFMHAAIALCHTEMSFNHPVSKESMDLKISCPFAL